MGSIGAADIARGVGNGLGVVGTVRVMAVHMYRYCMSHLCLNSPHLSSLACFTAEQGQLSLAALGTVLQQKDPCR